MSHYEVEQSGVIAAPPEAVYAVLKDYHHGHAAILPKPYFTKMTVEEGGVGAGTAVVVEMNVFGTKITYRLTVSEPEPGRVLLEEDKAAGVRTTFTLDPLENGRHTKVTIHTRAKTSPGIRGFMEKLMTPAITRKIYREELALLADYLKSTAANPEAS